MEVTTRITARARRGGWDALDDIDAMDAVEEAYFRDGSRWLRPTFMADVVGWVPFSFPVPLPSPLPWLLTRPRNPSPRSRRLMSMA